MSSLPVISFLFAAALVHEGPCAVVTPEGEAVDVAERIFYDPDNHYFVAEVESIKGDVLYTRYPDTFTIRTEDGTVIRVHHKRE